MAGFEDCTGCNLCVLPCPVWQQSHDKTLTLAGRAKALQAGAEASEMLASLEACVLCGACEPVCPENIDTIGMTLDLRAQVDSAIFKAADRTNIIDCVEAGLSIEPAVLETFLKPLRGQRRLVIAEGILHRQLRQWLPDVEVIGTGEALLENRALRAKLGPSDLYVVETRGYHADFKRLVLFYDALRLETGCVMNLDMQRAAIPTGAISLQNRLGKMAISASTQGDWILEGRKVTRVILESEADREAFAGKPGLTVLHLSQLAEKL